MYPVIAYHNCLQKNKVIAVHEWHKNNVPKIFSLLFEFHVNFFSAMLQKRRFISSSPYPKINPPNFDILNNRETRKLVFKIHQGNKKTGHNIPGLLGSNYPCLPHSHTFNKMVAG
jgi:hypothetical protein